MGKVKYPSLELNWLRKEYKCIPVPDIYYTEDIEEGYQGCYYSAKYRGQVIFMDNKEIEIGNGLIVLSNGKPSVLAHEYRHHIQTFYKNSKHIVDFNLEKPWDEAIVDYFTSSIDEWDALLYEMLKDPDDENGYIYELCIKKLASDYKQY